jgi:hypothetical protein
VEDGITGYVVESVEEAICKLGSVTALDRGRVRCRFEQRFTADRMAQDYLRAYATVIGARADRRVDRRAPSIPANRRTVLSPPPEAISSIPAFTRRASSGQHGTKAQGAIDGRSKDGWNDC